MHPPPKKKKKEKKKRPIEERWNQWRHDIILKPYPHQKNNIDKKYQICINQAMQHMYSPIGPLGDASFCTTLPLKNIYKKVKTALAKKVSSLTHLFYSLLRSSLV